MRFELYANAEEQPELLVQVEEWMQVVDVRFRTKRWFPKNSLVTKMAQEREAFKDKIVVDEVVLNPTVESKNFEIQVPDGTLADDLVNMRTYIVGDRDAHMKRMAEEAAALLQSTDTSNKLNAAPRSNRNVISWWILGGAVCLLVVGLVLRRRVT